uniref:Cytochrome c oxidase assembly factor 3 n=1 Tax=Strongyloides stercoralis TaxID=6248 RepID=A0A0K0E6B4_STRER
MFGRSLLSANLVRKSLTTSARRQVHKGGESTPPMRHVTNGQKFLFYLFVTGTFISYPSYVLYNMNNLRPHPENQLDSEVTEQLQARIAAKKEGTFKPFQ